MISEAELEDWVSNLYIDDLLISHRNIHTTKWGPGIDISDWFVNQGIETNSYYANILGNVIHQDIQVLLTCKNFQYALFNSFDYWDQESMGEYIPEAFRTYYVPFRKNYTDINPKKVYNVEIFIFPYILPKQNEPIKRKASCRINGIYQTMTWSLIEDSN